MYINLTIHLVNCILIVSAKRGRTADSDSDSEKHQDKKAHGKQEAKN